jgi:hypothetical protein
MYDSERQLKQWLTEDGVQFTTGDIAHALVLLESKGHIQRATVKPNASRPGWLAIAAATAVERGLGVNGQTATPDGVEAPEDRTVDVGPAHGEAVEPVETPEPDAVAVAILKTFDVPCRGFQGNRCLIESEGRLRQYLTEDAVSFDDSTLSAALTLLETATLPGFNTRLIRGTELHRRNSSQHLPAARMPSRAMLLEQVHMWDYKVYERADIEPYLIPAQGA